jgi:hypothetical protein
MEKELLLFSGGPDSTVLLKYFLIIKKPLVVLHIQMGWCNGLQPRVKIQKKRVDKLIKYFKKKYYDFEYMDAGIFLNCVRLLSIGIVKFGLVLNDEYLFISVKELLRFPYGFIFFLYAIIIRGVKHKI